jgi:AcrR family transcriptional regulator
MTDHRPRDADATRRDLLRAAQRRFAILGYDRTTTRDVAHDAGVNVSLINRYFGGKQGLFRAVVESAPEPTVPPSSGDLVTDFLDGLSPDAWPEFGAHPMLLLLRDSSADTEIAALRARGMRAAIERIVEAAGSGRPDGELRAELVLALFNGIIALRSMVPLEPLASAEVDALRGPLEDAIRALIGPGTAD